MLAEFIQPVRETGFDTPCSFANHLLTQNQPVISFFGMQEHFMRPARPDGPLDGIGAMMARQGSALAAAARESQ